MLETFYLGTHLVHWLALPARLEVPLFIARQRIEMYRTYPRAIDSWALDSGGFTELTQFGGWSITARAYVDAVRRFRTEIGMLEWAASQDWMCEKEALKKTGKTIREHQRLTVDNFLRLRDLAPEIDWLPTLQGFTPDDYFRCADLFLARGVDLARAPGRARLRLPPARHA